MSTFFASCAGLQIVAGSLVIPAVGAWTADVHLAGNTSVTGTVSVVIGNLTIKGTVVRSDVYGGQVRCRLVGGYGGWRTAIAPQGYGSPSGVNLGTILNDAAQACGEQLGTVNSANIGNGFVRVRFPTSVASDVLWQMLSQGFIPAWYVDPSGLTQIRAWPTTTIQSAFTVTEQRPDEGVITIATEDYASWMPGCQFSNPLLAAGETFTSAGVIYTWDNEGKFRFDVLTGTAKDRVLGPLQQIIEREIAPTRFYGRYAYTVSNPSSTTVDGTPVNADLGLPDVQNVPLRADSIASFTPQDGGACDIMFLDGVPTQPICVWCEADANAGPSTIVLGPQNTPTPPIARVDDTVIVLFPPLMQVAGTISGAPFVGVLTIVTPAQGLIQTGSPIVSSS